MKLQEYLNKLDEMSQAIKTAINKNQLDSLQPIIQNLIAIQRSAATLTMIGGVREKVLNQLDAVFFTCTRHAIALKAYDSLHALMPLANGCLQHKFDDEMGRWFERLNSLLMLKEKDSLKSMINKIRAQGICYRHLQSITKQGTAKHIQQAAKRLNNKASRLASQQDESDSRIINYLAAMNNVLQHLHHHVLENRVDRGGLFSFFGRKTTLQKAQAIAEDCLFYTKEPDDFVKKYHNLDQLIVDLRVEYQSLHFASEHLRKLAALHKEIGTLLGVEKVAGKEKTANPEDSDKPDKKLLQ